MSTSTGASTGRYSILNQITSNTQNKKLDPKVSGPVSEYFGELTFGLGHMREKLHKEAYENLLRALEKGDKITTETADAIAQAVKDWAVNMGATHFCHWFQPMTGLTAEKHDAFISVQHSNHSELSVIERFKGAQLIQGEPDASSFPSGGMRSTFEARGYTAWDPTTPMFIAESNNSRTLCIPSVFFGYHGEALDNKTPLLRSAHVVSQGACEFLKLLGDVDVKNIETTVGVEQEYFLIDRQFAALRPDIMMTGRTLLGAAPPRGQQLEDHYFGAIPSRVKIFMDDLECELYRLGIPVKTRHNEVAPSQFELAPIFENAAIACDHNTLTMETLKRVANRHGLYCLLHEKPFAELNGSGKHCNWSMSNDKGENLLEPGKTPHQNLRFLAILSVVMRAVHDHADILRASIASAGNDHRLGANEAPPAVISMFLGSLLSGILENIQEGKISGDAETQMINLGVGQIPDISKDYTDRNRTSPFAFTGNKFEFRAVGSATNTAVPMSVLNAAVAESFEKSTAQLKTLLEKGRNRDEAVMEFIREVSLETKPVHFEGNNYSEEWRIEAENRGLPVLNHTPAALKSFDNPVATQFLIKQKVLSEAEVKSRFNVGVERYVKTLMIELTMLSELVSTHVIPSVEKQLLRSYDILDEASSVLKGVYKKRTEVIEGTLSEMLEAQSELTALITSIGGLEDEVVKMDQIVTVAIPVRDRLRTAADRVELLVSDENWVLPKYREMLFTNAIS